MAYNTATLKKQALEAIEKHKLFTIQDVVAFIGCARSTFYLYIPDESDAHKEIEELMQRKRIELKISMRKKWFESDAPALQLGLYKLIATQEERSALSMKAVDVTSGGDKITDRVVQIEIVPRKEHKE